MQLINHINSIIYYRYLITDNLIELDDHNLLSKPQLSERFGSVTHFGYKHILPILRTDLAYDEATCPSLITLAQPNQLADEEFLKLIIKQAKQECFWSKRYICGYLVSQLSPQEMATKLIEAGDKIGLFFDGRFNPFFEPLRLEYLQTFANENEQQWIKELLSGVLYYGYPSIHHANTQLFMAPVANVLLSQRFSTELKIILSHFAEFKRLLILWYENAYRREQKIPINNNIMSKIMMLVEQMEQLKINHSADRKIWVLNSLSFDIDFTLHPDILTMVEQNKATPGHLGEAFITLTQAQWNNILSN